MDQGGIKLTLLMALSLCMSLASCNTRCPSGEVDIRPCLCSEARVSAEEYESTVTCKGAMGLPNLSAILRSKLCGYRIHKFRLISSDIQYLPSNLFYKVIVNDIQVSFTNISHFTEAGRSAFFGLEGHLSSLSMRRCKLVDALQWQKIGDLTTLSALDLTENDLTTVPIQWFPHPPANLKFLYLRANRISSIHPHALSKMHSLMVLDLSENFISTLDRFMFPHPGNSITFLKLSYNSLRQLPEDFFDEMFGLRRLYLDNNKFHTLEEKVWAPIWSELTTLDVMGNHLQCDCAMQWVSRLYPIKHLYGACAEDSAVGARELKSLWPWDFNCTNG